MSCAQLRFHAHVQGHNQGSEVSLRGLQGHLLHTVIILLVVFFCVFFLEVLHLTLKAPNKNCFYLLKKIRLDVSWESSAKQRIHLKHQVLF